MFRKIFVLCLTLEIICGYSTSAQHSPFSLQAAVDELHRREAVKYPLNSPPAHNYFGSNIDQDYGDEDNDSPANFYSTNRNPHRLNKSLAKFLEREDYESEQGGLSLGPFGIYEFDNGNNNDEYSVSGNNARNKFIKNAYPHQKKRSSFFRERDNKFDSNPSSLFRERESQYSLGNDESELAEQFLREIEENQKEDHEQRYKDVLRNLWEKYQQEDNDIDDGLFEEKKRIRTPPYYMLMAKKRSYPVLPWLPYSQRKKRFPVAKRSTKRASIENINFGKTDEKVAKELSELFGTSIQEKKKRSTHNEEPSYNHSTASNDTTDETKSLTNSSTTNHHMHKHEMQTEQKGKGENEESYEEEEDDESDENDNHDEHEEHEEHEGEEDDHDEYEDREDLKKKRDLTERQSPTFAMKGNYFRRKKSIDWSKYFGIDRKKKMLTQDQSGLDVKKRNALSDNSDDDKDANIKKKKRNIDPLKLESMDQKLQSIEDFIIDETVKYTGAHEGIEKPEEIRRLKDHVLSRLATAYSLEKMRRALEKLRQSVDNENHLLRNVIESDSHNNFDKTDFLENEKNFPLKKYKGSTNIFDSAIDKKNEPKMSDMMTNTDDKRKKKSEISESDNNDVKKKKKRSGYVRYPEVLNNFMDVDDETGTPHFESLNDAYLGNKNYILGSNQCPVIESMADRCRAVDILSGDINQELLPICGIHQICYLCGTSTVACDYQYLSEAEVICNDNNACQEAARSVLMILRGTPGPQIGPRECLKNTCLYNAMREIGL